MNKSSVRWILCMLAAITLTGCGFQKREFVEKKTFLLKIEHSDEQVSNPLIACFNIRLTRVAPAFTGSQLVYRTGAVTFEQDYYNTYLSPLDEQFEDIVSRWFRDSRQFVCESEKRQETEKLTLEPHLDELYADFQDESNPAGVAQMHFYMSRYDDGCGCPVELLKKTYKVRTPLPAKPTPEKVVQALSQSVTQILIQLETDIAGLF